MKNILNLLKTNLLKEGVNLENLKFKVYTNQVLVNANGLEVTITKRNNIFSVAVTDANCEFGSVVDVFNTVANAVEYATIEIRSMVNFPESTKEMLFDCGYLG